MSGISFLDIFNARTCDFVPLAFDIENDFWICCDVACYIMIRISSNLICIETVFSLHDFGWAVGLDSLMLSGQR